MGFQTRPHLSIRYLIDFRIFEIPVSHLDPHWTFLFAISDKMNNYSYISSCRELPYVLPTLKDTKYVLPMHNRYLISCNLKSRKIQNKDLCSEPKERFFSESGWHISLMSTPHPLGTTSAVAANYHYNFSIASSKRWKYYMPSLSVCSTYLSSMNVDLSI